MGRLQGPLQRLGAGGSREGYLSLCKRFVYKVPHWNVSRNAPAVWGVEDNALEASISAKWFYRVDSFGRSVARCKLIPGTNILVMERIAERMPRDFQAPWSVSIDGGQGGITRSGRFALYDYASVCQSEWLNPPERFPQKKAA